MEKVIQREFEKTIAKRDEMREILKNMEEAATKDQYTITLTRDRLAYWEGKAEGLRFALDQLSGS